MTDENITLCPGCCTELYDAADAAALCDECKPEYDDEEFNNDATINYCHNCSGSGEGMYDGTVCWRCNGRGVINRHNEIEKL
jgi:DnaJ-class molecular chaperone